MRASFVVGEVLTGLRRNVTMTIAMMLTTAISLALVGTGLLAVRTIDRHRGSSTSDGRGLGLPRRRRRPTDASCSQPICRACMRR